MYAPFLPEPVPCVTVVAFQWAVSELLSGGRKPAGSHMLILRDSLAAGRGS